MKSDAWGVYRDPPRGRSIPPMNSQLNQLLIAGRLEDDIHAAAAARQARELRRQARAPVLTKRQWFARRQAASTS